jgi:hypothetical protein
MSHQNAEKLLNRALFGLILLGVAMVVFGCEGNISLFGSPSQTSGARQQASPTPTPSPSPSASPAPSSSPTASDLCMPTHATIHFHSSPAEDRTVIAGATRGLDFTPFRGSVQLPDSCNVARFPVWSVETVKANPSSSSACSLLGALQSYIPVLQASTRPGDVCVVKATLNVVSGENIVPFPAVFEALVK